MAAPHENTGKDRDPNEVAEQQHQQALQGQRLGASPHQAADPAAEPAGDAPLGQERDPCGEGDPTEIDQCAERRAVLVEGAPFARQRGRGVRQHADIRHRLAFELHGDVLDPAAGAHLAAHCRRCRRRVGRLARRGRNQKRCEDGEQDQTPPESERTSDAFEPQPHCPRLLQDDAILGDLPVPGAEFLAGGRDPSVGVR